MSVIVSNVAAREINCNEKGKITWSDWSESLTAFFAGSYNSSYKYVAQIRFRLSAPCSSITFVARSHMSNYSGTVYWKYSEDEANETLAKASYIDGQEYDVVTTFGRAYEMVKVTIEGKFPANKDLYLYGFHYAAGNTYAAVHMYALYDTTYFTKVVEGTEIEGVVHLDSSNDFAYCQIHIDDGASVDAYIPHIDNGTGWDLCGMRSPAMES